MSSRAPAAPGTGFETALVAAGAAVLGVGYGTWLGARLAVALGGGRVTGGLDVGLRVTARLVRGESPATAWGANAELPSATLYWACTAAVGLALVGAARGGGRGVAQEYGRWSAPALRASG